MKRKTLFKPATSKGCSLPRMKYSYKALAIPFKKMFLYSKIGYKETFMFFPRVSIPPRIRKFREFLKETNIRKFKTAMISPKTKIPVRCIPFIC